MVVECIFSNDPKPRFFLKFRLVAVLGTGGHSAMMVMAEPEVEAVAGLGGLAELWEGYSLIRQQARQNDSLLKWPTAETVGIPSMSLICNELQWNHVSMFALNLCNQFLWNNQKIGLLKFNLNLGFLNLGLLWTKMRKCCAPLRSVGSKYLTLKRLVMSLAHHLFIWLLRRYLECIRQKNIM